MQCDDGIHLESQHDLCARLNRARICQSERSVRVRFYTTKPVHVSHQIARAQTIFCELDKEAVATVANKLIAFVLIAGRAPLAGNQSAVAGPAGRIMSTAIIRYDRAKNAPHIRIKAMPLVDFKGVLTLQRVGQIEPLQWIFGVIHKRGDVAAAEYIR